MAPTPSTASAAPTGCFKCGRPGHWSRDCPSSAPKTPSSQQNAINNNASPAAGSWNPSPTPTPPSAWKNSKLASKPALASKATLPRKRPKLTPDLLLSNEGLGYILEHFPRMVKIQGPGHEVEDLQSFLEAYVHWHSRILPYFSFDQFVERVEKLGSSKRVRLCVNDLKNKVARGEDVQISPEENEDVAGTDDFLDDNDDMPNDDGNLESWEEPEDNPLPADINEEMFDEFYKQAVDENSTQSPGLTTKTNSTKDTQPDASKDTSSNRGGENLQKEESVQNTLSEDQIARMEANRLRALERAKARLAATAAP